MAVLAGAGLVLGGLGGIAADVVVRLVALISNLALLHRVGWVLPDLRHYHPTPLLLLVAAAGAVVVVVLARWSPIVKGHGIPESLEAIIWRESRVQPRAALAKPVSAAVAMGTGGPFGAEGPIIVTGASLGSLLGQLVPVSPAERRILLATGAAAGMAGVFATPIAAVVMAFELLLFERSLRSLVPLVLATSVAAALHAVLLGPHPLFAVVHPLAFRVDQLPLFAVLGLAAGALAVLLNRGLFATEAGFRRLPIPAWTRPILGALGFGAIGLAVPGSLSVGYWAITDAVNGRFLLGGAAALFAGKTASWWIGLGSETSGGTLAPMFLIGAAMGEMIGIGFAHAFPGAHIQPGAFALVGMGVTFGVGARALLTGVVFAAEVTGAFSMLVPLLLAVAVAELVAEIGLDERIMTEKLRRRGTRVDFDSQADPLRQRVAGQVMRPDLTTSGITPAGMTVDHEAYLSDALPLLIDPEVRSVTVTERGRPVGTLTWAEINAEFRRRIADEQIQPPNLCRRSRRVMRPDVGAVATTRSDDGRPGYHPEFPHDPAGPPEGTSPEPPRTAPPGSDERTGPDDQATSAGTRANMAQHRPTPGGTPRGRATESTRAAASGGDPPLVDSTTTTEETSGPAHITTDRAHGPSPKGQ